MKSARGWLALAVLLGCGVSVHAQVLYGPGIGVGGTFRSGRLSIGFGAFSPGGFYPSFGYPGPYGYPYGYSNRTTVLQIYTPPPPPPVLIAAPPPPAFGPRFDFVNDPVIAPGQRVPLVEAPPPAERPLPGAPAGVFRPLRPEDRAGALQPIPLPPPDKPKPPDKPRPADKPKPEAPPDRLPRPPLPQADPRAENARQATLGKEAFANQEYGRALNRFRQAVAASPDEPTAHFLLGQTLFALGKYAEAVEAIQAGLRLRPDWPRLRFQPLELYEPNVALYPEQLQRLEEVLANHPNDPALLFLYAYQLWFDGRKDEARLLFQRAVPLAPDRTFIDRFLQALPGQPII